jgi:AraC-like DNA-binding protein
MLGWYVGRFVGDLNLNRTLLQKLEKAPTLLEALRRLIRMVATEASHLQLGICERNDDVIFFTHYPDLKQMPGYYSSQAYQLGVYLDLIRHFMGRDWVPEEIGIEYPIVPAVVTERFPGSRILARQRMGYISIPRHCLHVAGPRNDSIESVEDSENTGSLDYVDTLRALLKPYLSDPLFSAELAASLMDTSSRTLVRRLSASGTTYRAVADELRFSVAKELLESSSARIIDIAHEVGFDDPSHFARMFRRVGGVSPQEFRKSLR